MTNGQLWWDQSQLRTSQQSRYRGRLSLSLLLIGTHEQFDLGADLLWFERNLPSADDLENQRYRSWSTGDSLSTFAYRSFFSPLSLCLSLWRRWLTHHPSLRRLFIDWYHKKSEETPNYERQTKKEDPNRIFNRSDLLTSARSEEKVENGLIIGQVYLFAIDSPSGYVQQ